MSTRAELEGLESELQTSKDFEGRKDDAATTVTDYFVALKGPEPNDDQILEHFSQRRYPSTSLDLSDTQLGQYSKQELEEASYDLMSRALYSRLLQRPDEATGYFEQAVRIAEILDDPFLRQQYDYAIVLDGAALNAKLKTDRCYELINKTLLTDNQRDAAFALIGTGLTLAEQNQDDKRTLDFLGKCQYALYEYENFPHVALSLGRYLLAHTAAYRTLNGWTHFHNGNILLDFKDPQSAKNEFEDTVDWAIDCGFSYAAMTMYERLGLACKNLDKLNLAAQNYDDSLAIAETEAIKPWLVTKNQVRCYIGLGLIQMKHAENLTGDAQQQAFDLAEDFLKRAAEIANQVNYLANEAAALSSLGELYRTKEGSESPVAKSYHKLAHQIKTDKLKLDPNCERVKKDADHM